MCGGIYYVYREQEYRYYFSNPAATLPVKMKTGHYEILPWGRRREQRGKLPLGGWARLALGSLATSRRKDPVK